MNIPISTRESQLLKINRDLKAELVKAKTKLKNVEVAQEVSILRAGAAIAGGATAAYVVYNHPDRVLNYLAELDYNPVLARLMPYALELATVGASITGYAVSYAISPMVLYPIMKLVQGIDYAIKTLLVTLPIAVLKGVGVYGLAQLAYEYRGTLCLLALAYLYPENAMALLAIAYHYIAHIVSFAVNEPVKAGLLGVGGMLVYKKLTKRQILTINQLEVGNKIFNIARPEILPSKPKGVSTEDFLQEIANKVQRGHLLYKQILDGDGRDLQNQPATKGEISDILWFLQVKGEEKAGAFDAGSFNVEDTEACSLVRFMDSCKDIYQRESSHIKEMQKFASHRGIDFVLSSYDANEEDALRSYLDRSLPYDMQTLMIAPMLESSGYMPQNRVLLKLETHGAWISPVRDDLTKGPKSRAFQYADLGQSIVHGLSLVKTQVMNKISGNVNPEGSRKERVPAELIKKYNVFIKSFKDLKQEEIVGILESKNPKSTSGGIRIMLENINAVVEYQNQGMMWDANQEQKIQDTNREMGEFCAEINNNRARWDHCDVRIGDEVIHNRVELENL